MLDALETLSEDEEFRRELFPIFRTETDEASAVRIRDVYGMAENLDLDKGQREALIEAYKKDVMEVDMKTLAEATPLGELLLDTRTAAPMRWRTPRQCPWTALTRGARI